MQQLNTISGVMSCWMLLANFGQWNCLTGKVDNETNSASVVGPDTALCLLCSKAKDCSPSKTGRSSEVEHISAALPRTASAYNEGPKTKGWPLISITWGRSRAAATYRAKRAIRLSSLTVQPWGSTSGGRHFATSNRSFVCIIWMWAFGSAERPNIQAFGSE